MRSSSGADMGPILKDMALISSFQAYMAAETYAQMQDTNMLLASILSMMVDERTRKLN